MAKKSTKATKPAGGKKSPAPKKATDTKGKSMPKKKPAKKKAAIQFIDIADLAGAGELAQGNGNFATVGGSQITAVSLEAYVYQNFRVGSGASSVVRDGLIGITARDAQGKEYSYVFDPVGGNISAKLETAGRILERIAQNRCKVPLVFTVNGNQIVG